MYYFPFSRAARFSHPECTTHFSDFHPRRFERKTRWCFSRLGDVIVIATIIRNYYAGARFSDITPGDVTSWAIRSRPGKIKAQISISTTLATRTERNLSQKSRARSAQRSKKTIKKPKLSGNRSLAVFGQQLNLFPLYFGLLYNFFLANGPELSFPREVLANT